MVGGFVGLFFSSLFFYVKSKLSHIFIQKKKKSAVVHTHTQKYILG